jgi:hypothetical protein
MVSAGIVRRLGLFVAVVILLPDPAASGSAALQNENRQQRLEQALRILEQRVSGSARSIGWLRKTAGTTVPEPALKSLEALVDAVQRAEHAPDREKILDAVRQDLAIKSAVCQKSPEGMGALVQLVVHTWTSSEPRTEVPQWNVHYLSAPLFLLGDDRSESFPSFSSPTALSLPPGLYVVWAQHPEMPKRGPTREVTLGNIDGSASGAVKADVIVPEK